MHPDTDEYIREGNSLIAEFCGANKVVKSKEVYYEWDNGHNYHVDDLKFYTDWNWIMRAIDVIENLESNPLRGYKVIVGRCAIVESPAREHYKDSHELIIVNSHRRNRIQMTWKCVVDFIKWYNKKVKNKS